MIKKIIETPIRIVSAFVGNASIPPSIKPKIIFIADFIVTSQGLEPIGTPYETLEPRLIKR